MLLSETGQWYPLTLEVGFPAAAVKLRLNFRPQWQDKDVRTIYWNQTTILPGPTMHLAADLIHQ